MCQDDNFVHACDRMFLTVAGSYNWRWGEHFIIIVNRIMSLNVSVSILLSTEAFNYHSFKFIIPKTTSLFWTLLVSFYCAQFTSHRHSTFVHLAWNQTHLLCCYCNKISVLLLLMKVIKNCCHKISLLVWVLWIF